MELPAEEVGQQAVAMLMEMFEQKTHILPGRYLEIPVFPGATTTESENACLMTEPALDPVI